MIPQTSSNDNFDYLLFGLTTNGNTPDETQSTREPFQSYCIAADKNVEISSFNGSGYLKETLHNKRKTGLNRKRVQAFVEPPSKGRKTDSFRKTRLCVELPSKNEISKSSSRPELQKSRRTSISSSKISSSHMGNNLSKKKTPQKEVNNGKTTSNKNSQLHLKQINSEDEKNPGKSYSTEQKKIGLSVHSQIATISRDNSTVSRIGSKAEVNLFNSRAHNSKNDHILCHKSLTSSLDSEDPLTGSIPIKNFHIKTRNSSHKLATSQPRQKSPYLCTINNSSNKDPASSENVSVPDPIYHPFKCEWEGCHAELMNMEILRKHVYAAHGKKLEDGERRCLWGKCGLAWKETCTEEFTTASPNNNGLVIDSRKSFLKRRDWKEHMEEIHLIPFSWHMGDGPCGSRLLKPSTVWQQPYLFFADGQQITPSVASQPIEKGVA
ncbi:hypothetical protein EPUL_004976, partial [Erysiphe pulchra]